MREPQFIEESVASGEVRLALRPYGMNSKRRGSSWPWPAAQGAAALLQMESVGCLHSRGGGEGIRPQRRKAHAVVHYTHTRSLLSSAEHPSAAKAPSGEV